MKYKKVTVILRPNNEIASQLLMDAMGERGFESFMETDDGFEGYIQEDLWKEGGDGSTMENIKPEIKGVKMSWHAEDAPDEDWNAEWEKSGYTPIYISGGACVIHGPLTEGLGRELDIIIDPRNAFGSGHHETTRMMVEGIMETDMRGKNVMDMGCGTGVLGIASALRGASHVDALDIDEWSVKNTEDNATLNGVGDKVTAAKGSTEALDEVVEKYDVFIANIFREVIISGMASYASATKPGGIMMLSGFLTDDLKEIEAAGSRQGMEVIGHKNDGEWQMCVMRKK